MDFILTDALEEDQLNLQLSDDEIEEGDTEDDAFIDDAPMEQDSISFYRDPTILDSYPKFENQTRNPIEVINADTEDYFGNDDQSELYAPEVRDNIEFDFFENYEKSSEKFKKLLLCFENVENHLFYAVIYGLMYMKTEKGQSIKKENAREVLRDELFFKLKEIEETNMLDKSLFGYFSRYSKINEVLVKHRYFLRFLERRNQHRYQIKKRR